MAGDFFAKERAAVTLQNGDGASLTDSSAGAASTADLDARSGGNVADDFEMALRLSCSFGSAPSVGKQVDVYLIPKFDGTTASTVDTTAGASVLPATAYRGSFVISKSQTSQVLDLEGIPLSPLLYSVYLLNRTGQTLSANWTLKVISTRGQYS